MGVTAQYQFVRDASLTADERVALAELAATLNEEPWNAEAFRLEVARGNAPHGVVACGWMKLAASDGSRDLDRLRAALEAISTRLGAELRVTDDLDALGGSMQPLVEVSRADFVDIATLAPSPSVKLTKKLATLVAGNGAATDERTIAQALRSLADLGREHPTALALRALISRSAPALVASAGLRNYGPLHRKNSAWGVVHEAMKHVDEVAPVTPAFLAMWRAPRGIYWYHDLWIPLRLSAALAVEPAVETELLDALREANDASVDDELSYRRAERAAMMLAHGRSDAGLGALLSTLRETRTARKPHSHRYHVRIPALRALTGNDDARCFATFVLELDRMSSLGQPYGDLVSAIARIDAARARPIVLELARRSILPDSTIAALAVLGQQDRDTCRALAAFLVHPNPAVWKRARAALDGMGESFNTDIAEPAPEDLVTHPDLETRHRALATIANRRDRSTCVSLMAGELLDAVLRQHIDYPGLPFSWHDWKDVLPRHARYLGTRARLAWALDEGKAQLGPQVVFDAIRPVLERGATAVAAEYPSPLFRLADADRAALEREEDSVLRVLGLTP